MKKKLLIMATAAVLGACTDVPEKEDWGHVYDGAITENVAGQVNLFPVKYDLRGITVAANVYTPAGYDPAKTYAAVVVAHPNGGVKEQVAGLYAQKLAEAGYITIAADASYQGASSGEPRGYDVPEYRINDIRGMVDFIQQYPGVDPERVGALGICGGGGYTLGAAQNDKRIKAVATLSMFNTGDVRRNGYMRTQTATIQERLKAAAEARAREAAGGPVEYPAGMGNMTPEEAQKIPVDLYRDGYFYYVVDYFHPNDGGTAPTSCMLDLMMWDATDRMELIDQPLLMMAGSIADSKYMSDEAFEKATGTTDKEYFIIEGATHIRTYFVPEYVEQVETKLKEFFGKRL